MRNRYPCTSQKAGYVLWHIYVERLTQTETALLVQLNGGTVSHVARGHRFPGARPIKPPYRH